MKKPTAATQTAQIDYSGLAFPKTRNFREWAKGKPKGPSGGFAAILAKPMIKALGDYYAKTALPKGASRKTVKGRKDRANRKTRKSVKVQVFERDQVCRGWGTSQVCTKRPVDRHELIPMGRGGKITTTNCVAVCRRCHDAAQNALGGLPLAFDWEGKGEGKAPDADTPGAVWAVWRNIWRGVKSTGRG